MSKATVYAFEEVFETAIGQVFVQNGITAYSILGEVQLDGTTDLTIPLQRKRPRVDITFTKGADRDHLHLVNDSDPYTQAVWDGYAATLQIDLVTEPNAQTHLGFLSTVRFILARLPSLVTLANHTLHFPVKDNGEEHFYTSGQGDYMTRSKLAFTFSVDRHTWALLSQP